MRYRLNKVADTLGIHPRTVLRAITNEENPYWTEKYDPWIELDDIIDSFGCTAKQFRRLVKGDDFLMSPDEVATFLNVSTRTLRYRKAAGEITPIVNRGTVVRYSKEAILEREYRKAAI